MRVALLVLMASVAITAPGCSCREETPAERAAREAREAEEAKKKEEEEKKKKKKPALEVQEPIPQPGQDDIVNLLVKPGHWMTAKQTMKPNYDDWVGETTLQVVDERSQPIPIDRTGYTVRSSREVALAKGEAKDIESVVFIPTVSSKMQWRSTLRERGAGLPQPPVAPTLRRMRPHQHHFVVLGKESQRYGFLDTLTSIDAPLSSRWGNEFGSGDVLPMSRQFRVVAPDIADRIPLPENPLCWSSVAYLLWDEVDPTRITPEQQAALVDWIHWGGQLIVSGPDSLDLLRDSFLDPYLPADSGGARLITADDLKPLTTAWNASRRRGPLKPVRDWSGIHLNLRQEAEPLAVGGKLFAERRVGRGRVIISAMQLTERELFNWQEGFESLFNGLVLRRPPRRFKWDPTYYAQTGEVTGRVFVMRNRPEERSVMDNSDLRFFSRDTHGAAVSLAYQEVTDIETGGWGMNNVETHRLADPSMGGPAAWDDFNSVATAARGSLREAAGVDIPGSGFVVACLAVYLTVLAPFNWFFFKALGRVELAWVAAPVIALAGAWVVVKQAQLDIGFVRAQTEVAVLETQPDHPRGHLTRYLSFYTSLSTTYNLEFDDPTSLAAPFARSEKSPLRSGDQPTIVNFQRLEKARLRGLAVQSNSTEFAHAEQMIDLAGALRFDDGRNRLTNEMDHDFEAVAVVHRPETGEETLRGCWIGQLERRSSVNVSFPPLGADPAKTLFAEERAAATGAGAQAGLERLDLESLFALALDPTRIEPGEVRAVGLLREVLPGVSVTPKASQLRGATLVVAHLKYGPLGAPQADANAPMDQKPR